MRPPIAPASAGARDLWLADARRWVAGPACFARESKDGAQSAPGPAMTLQVADLPHPQIPGAVHVAVVGARGARCFFRRQIDGLAQAQRLGLQARIRFGVD